MKIKIIQIGKNKEKFIELALKKFEKLLKSLGVDLEILTLKEFSPSKTFSVERCKEEEGKEILKILEKLEKKSLGNLEILVLDEKGKEFTSKDFARKIGKVSSQGKEIVFVIGGAFGLSEEFKRNSDENFPKIHKKFKLSNGIPISKVSFSKMTLTHQMIRIFLLEQIYRGCCILSDKKYHHD